MQEGQNSDFSDFDDPEMDKDYIPSTESGSENEAETPAVIVLNTTIPDHTNIPKTSNNTEEVARSTHSDTEARNVNVVLRSGEKIFSRENEIWVKHMSHHMESTLTQGKLDLHVVNNVE
ncbi:hypothetical protein PR048_015378 [Dryococelus australis]|uniref:Uncharacterized protein n=1 Tax=Dryococelus australis TaxID=614101 RepID=A0ABQ9HGW5_9NEOP|nr:hypothetical protein PR048_015378 [Dryococelus australis]